VENVSWKDCQSWLEKLCEHHETPQLSLPTEAQWEYAARGETTTAWSFGEDVTSLINYAWYSGNSGNQTRPVNHKPANAFGLYGVHGSVWEWTRSWWFGSHPGGNVTDYEWPDSGNYRVVRGGAWNSSSEKTRSAYRDWGAPGVREPTIGFRLALSPVQ